MNRQQRSADTAANRKPLDRAEAVRLTYDQLGNSADPTLSGATVIKLDGSMTYISAADAQAMHGKAKPGGRA